MSARAKRTAKKKATKKRAPRKKSNRNTANGAGDLLVRGAREHNLKDVTVAIPRDKLVVITGVSGSGKSSLAFDTIYAEGQRRYVESLSAYARQFLEQMDKPDVDAIEGLSPAISIEQRNIARNPRSTVGTVTEIYDHLRLLFARVGRPHCWKCGKEIASQTVQQMVDRILDLPDGTRLSLLAPLVRGRKGHYKRDLARLRREGFVRVRVDGDVRSLDEEITLDKNKKHTIEVYIDRIKLREGIAGRLADSLETALKLADGIALVEAEGKEPPMLLSERFACPDCGTSFPEIQPRTFSFNSPHGACPDCQGLGLATEIDPELVVPDPSLTLHQGALAPWGTTSEYFEQMLQTVAKAYTFDLDTPWSKLSAEARKIILYGSGRKAFRFELEGSHGRGHRFTRPWEGMIPSLERRYRETESEASREEYEKYMSRKPCPTCKGARLRSEALHVLIGDQNISAVAALSVEGVRHFLGELKLSRTESEIARRLLKELNERLTFLSNVGLDYLTLDRATATLAGGEAQRIRLATQIGAALVGVLYVLDEPSIGLHPRDNARLLETLKRLRDLGNTVLVVEHDEETIRTADHVIDLGPGAGVQGGEVVAEGTAKAVERVSASLTGQYLSGKKQIDVPDERRAPRRGALKLKGAHQHNLKRIDVEFPLGRLIAVTGVSGSGKSSLVLDTLYPALARHLHRSIVEVGAHERLTGLTLIDKVIDIDQSPIGRTPRSNPATYTGTFTPIRDLYAQLPESRMRGYKPGRFSFNVKGGRCEACRGDGTLRIEMHFLPDVYVRCDQCEGRRFNRETLEIKYRGASIADALQMTVRQAGEFFKAVPVIRRKLQLLQDVGLGYLQLGQPATTLSGGEAQRIKLSRELSKRSTGRTVYVLDEPTTGLHFDDVGKLLGVLSRLVDSGNTVIVIEHNLEVIKTADWIVDLGPEGGDKGGKVVAAGTPEQIAKNRKSHTGTFLKSVLARR